MRFPQGSTRAYAHADHHNVFRAIIFAAMDTTSNAMARTVQLLAEHPQVQTKLRREIIDAKAGGSHLDYDQLHSLPYLDAVCRETLRL